MNIFNQIKKSVASFTLGALLFGFVTPVANAQLGFTDDAEIPSWAFEAIDELMSQGVVSGNADGSFAPNRQLNRAEVSKIITLSTGVDLDVTGGPNFPDVAQDAWYYDYVETMYNYGWINGYPDGMFRPEVGINRAEIAKMVVNAFEIDPDTAGAPHFDDVTSTDWFFSYVETAYNNGLMRGYGDGTFGPADAVTRAQTVKIVYDSQLVVTGPTGVSAGTLEVTLSSDTPRGTNIPYNATSVPFTTLEMTASDDASVELDAITFTRLGLGDNDDFDNVWLEIDGFKVGNDKSVNNDDVVELRFNPPVIIPAGQTVLADVVASMDYTLGTDNTCFSVGNDGCNIGHHNRFALVSADDIASSAANVVGPFPIEGEEMEIADYQVTQVEFQVLGSDTSIDVGDNFIEIGKYRMLNESNTNKDIELRAVTFKNDGTSELDEVLENVALYVSGEQISAETIIDGDYITFRLDNGVTGGYILEDGDSRIFSIRADVVSAEKGDTINFKIDNFEDIVGIEIGTSFGVKAISNTRTSLETGTSAGTTDSSVSEDEDAEDDFARLRLYTIDTGDLNVSRDPSSLGNQQYAPGSNDVVFLSARVVVDQPLIVDGLKIRVADSTGIANLAQLNEDFDNFRLFLNDKLIDTENDFVDSDSDEDVIVGDYLDFNTTFEIAGTSVIKLVANIQDDAVTGESLSLSLSASDFASPEYISTGDQVDTSQLLGSAEASAVEVEVSQVTISKSDGLSDADELVAGVDDITLMEFTLSNNDSGDINVTSVTIEGVGTGTPAANYANFTAAIFVDGIQQGSSKNLNTTTGLATFNDLSVIIATSDQKEFAVVVDTIESISDSNPANTTVADDGNATLTLPALGGSPYATGAANPGTTVLTVIGGGADIANFTSGTQVTVWEDADTGSDIDAGETQETATVTGANTTNAGADLVVTFSPGLTNTYPGPNTMVGITQSQYLAGTTTFGVASTANISVNDVLVIGGVDECRVTAVGTNSITVDNCDTTIDDAANGAAGSFLSATVTAGTTTVTESGTGDKFAINIVAVDADNIENGQQVDVLEGGITLGVEVNDVSDCTSRIATNNYLCGAQFNVLKSGSLFVEFEDFDEDSQILVEGQESVEVFRMKLVANDDDVEVKDIYLQNISGDNISERLDFELRDESGSLIQSRTMVNGQLHFELSNANRIRVPKDDNLSVSVYADVRDINTFSQTAQQLQLEVNVNATGSTNGFEANTVATGRDLDDLSLNTADVPATAVNFIVYKTKVTVDTAANQPNLVDGAARSGLYRFVVTPDAAGDATLERVTLTVSPSTELSYSAVAVPTDFLIVRCDSATKCDDEDVVASTVDFVDAAGATGAAFVQGDGAGVIAANKLRYTFTASENIDGPVYYEIQTTAALTDSGDSDDFITATFSSDVEIITDNNALTNVRATGLASTDGTNEFNFIFSDRSNSGSAGAYLNGFLIDFPDTSDNKGATE